MDKTMKFGIMKKLSTIIFLLVAWVSTSWAQMPGGRSVEVSHKVQTLHGKRYFIHIVEPGQTVYAISRAYGLKEVEAITKKDIHFLQIGDTVWLPCKGQKLADGTVAPLATGDKVDANPATEKANSNGQKTSQAAAQEAPITLGPVANIRPRVNAQNIVVSVMLPLNLSQMDKISTSKFDVEQRGKTSYKSLEFIQFYEGLLLGLDRLDKLGYNVTLNVVDVENSDDESVEKAFTSHNVAQSDLLIAMLTRQPFAKAAQLARNAQLFIVNPAADRSEIVKDNPYVFKCMPSIEAYAKRTVQAIKAAYPQSQVLIMQSGAKAEKESIASLTDELKDQNLSYTILDWSQPSKLSAAVKAASNPVVVSLYNQDKSKNRIYASQLLNKLTSFKSNITLFTYEDWTSLYSDIDLAQLQSLNYHTFYTDWNRASDNQKAFIDRFAEQYSTEPTNVYAGMANDIILYFVNGLMKKGTEFFRSPVMAMPAGMLQPLSFSHARADYGFENQSAQLFRLIDYHFNPVPSVQ